MTKNKDLLSSFMKKQMSEKSTKKIAANKVAKSAQKEKNSEASKEGEEAQEQNSDQEEMTEEEQLEEAKKASRNKAAERDQTEMLKKLFMENAMKYVVLISVLVIFSIGLIKFGPAILNFLNGFLYKIIMSAIGK